MAQSSAAGDPEFALLAAGTTTLRESPAAQSMGAMPSAYGAHKKANVFSVFTISTATVHAVIGERRIQISLLPSLRQPHAARQPIIAASSACTKYRNEIL
jgi:hypothetical protein